ncbi:MAG: LamG domain-containing protein [Nitrosopumilus sp.]|nr:LamG domain-containing protein [Nitrosopumilus sp.]
MGTSEKVSFKVCNGTTCWETFSSVDSVPLGEWTHIAATYSGNSNQNGMSIYIDGDLDTTGSTNTITGSIANNLGFMIGSETDGSNATFTGTIDDVRVYDVELTSQQVRSVYDENPFVQIASVDATAQNNVVQIASVDATAQNNVVQIASVDATAQNNVVQIASVDATAQNNVVQIASVNVTNQQQTLDIISVNSIITTLDAQVSIIDTLVDYIDTFLNGIFLNYDP